MDVVHRPCRLAGIALCAVLVWSTPVAAYLGGDVRGVGTDALSLEGTVITTTLVYYDVHQIATPMGQTIREYVTRVGQVFAITWSGPVAPDLSLLLGPYFAEYTASLSSLEHPGLRRSLRVATPALIVETSGHLRAYSGRAYVPALLPEGVSISDLH